MVEVGCRGEVASPPRPIVGSKRPYPEKNYFQLRIEAAGCGCGLGETGERVHSSRCPARSGHNRKGTKPHVQMVNLEKCYGRGGGDSGVTEVPDG